MSTGSTGDPSRKRFVNQARQPVLQPPIIRWSFIEPRRGLLLQDEEKHAELFAAFGMAWRQNSSLSFREFERQIGQNRNTLIPKIRALEKHWKILLVPRQVITTGSHGKRRKVVIEDHAALSSAEGKPERIPGLTQFGSALTDYWIVRRTIDEMWAQVLEQVELPAVRAIDGFGSASVFYGGDSPARRRELRQASAAYLSGLARDVTPVRRALPGNPLTALEAHVAAERDGPWTRDRIAAHFADQEREPSDWGGR